MQRRVLPGEQRRPARQARRRPRVVTMEVQTTPAKRLAGREAVAAKRCDGLGLIRRWVPLLVRHDDENVRRARGRRLVSLTVCDAGTERGLSGLWCLVGRRPRAGAGRRGAPALPEVPAQTRRLVRVRGLGPRVSDACLAITAVRTSSTRSRAPAKPAPRLSPPRPYLRAALARRPRPGRSGKSRPGQHKAPEPGGHSQPEGSVSCLRAVSAAAVVASADLATGSRRCGAATPVGRSIHAIPSGVQLTATVDGNPAVSSPTSPDAARHDSHVTDLRGRQPTHCLALRIKRLRVRILSSAPLLRRSEAWDHRSRSLMTPVPLRVPRRGRSSAADLVQDHRREQVAERIAARYWADPDLQQA